MFFFKNILNLHNNRMLVPKPIRKRVYTNLFNNGVVVAKKVIFKQQKKKIIAIEILINNNIMIIFENNKNLIIKQKHEIIKTGLQQQAPRNEGCSKPHGHQIVAIFGFP